MTLFLSESLEFILKLFNPSFVSDIFIIIIVVILLLSLVEANKGKHSQFLGHAPSLMTSLGILGTFVGIVIGLLDFNPSDIDKSISPLLEGLKTAFTTSLVGMLASIIFKTLDAWKFAPKREGDDLQDQDITPEKFYKVMKENNKLTTELIKGITGEQEGSLIGEFKILRTNVSDFKNNTETARKEFNTRLWEELQNFATMLSESATKHVIDALNQVIREFNQELREQFGENFKHLDESVKELVTWQKQYMQQLTQMTDNYAEGVKAIEDTKNAVINISEKTAEIPVSMKNLSEVIEVNQHQISELQQHLEAFVTMREKAVAAVPEIQEQITNVSTQLQNGAEQMRIVLLEGATSFKDSVGQTNASMNDMVVNINTQTNEIATTLKDSTQEINATNREMIQNLSTGAKNLQEQMDSTVQSVLDSITRNVEKNLSGVNQQIEEAEHYFHGLVQYDDSRNLVEVDPDNGNAIGMAKIKNT